METKATRLKKGIYRLDKWFFKAIHQLELLTGKGSAVIIIAALRLICACLPASIYHRIYHHIQLGDTFVRRKVCLSATSPHHA